MFNYPRSLAFPALRRRIAGGAMRRLFGAPAQALDSPLPVTGIHRILVCHVSHTLGNSLLLTPLIQELERVYPGAEIDIVSRSQIASQIYGRYPNVAKVLSMPAHGAKHLPTVLRNWRALRAGRYDLAIDTDPQSQTGRLMVMWSQARFTLGYSGPRKSGNVTHAVPFADAPRRKGRQGVFLLRRALGIAEAEAGWPLPDVKLDADERRQGREALERLRPLASDRMRPIIGVFANATGRKRMEGEWWHAFLDQLKDLERDHDVVEILPAFGRSMLDHRYPTSFCSDMRRLAGVLSGLDACVIGDCGVMHLTHAVGTPVIALFIETDPEEWGPYGDGHHVIEVARDRPEAAAAQARALLAAPAVTPKAA